MNDSSVAQLHRTLVGALRRSRPGALNRPVTVAEIYQDLVPYREARAQAGFEMNADYEHALLRLLAGEGDLARIEPREVRDKLRMELDSPNPNVGLYRHYAACDVWVHVPEEEVEDDAAAQTAAETASWEDEFLGGDAGEDFEDVEVVLEDEADDLAEGTGPSWPARFEIAADEDAEDTEEAEEAEDDGGSRSPQPGPERAVAKPMLHREPVEQNAHDSCAFCNAELPHDRMVNFCPFCGTDQSQQPCPSCGEMLDPLWRFCVSCGARARPLGDHVN